MNLRILPHRADLFAGAAAAVEHAVAIFCAAVNGERKIFTAVLAGAHRNPLLDTFPQGKGDQIIHALRIKHLSELFLLYKLERNLHRLEVEFLQRWSLFIRLLPNGKADICDACVQNRLKQAQNLLLHGRKVAWDVCQFLVRQQLRRIFAIRCRLF